MREAEVIDEICEIATTSQWSIYDVMDLYKIKAPELDTWGLLKRMLVDGLVRVDSQGVLSVYH